VPVAALAVLWRSADASLCPGRGGKRFLVPPDGLRKLLARVDAELGVRVAEVGVDRSCGDEQGLGDLLARVASGGHLRHA
jgi:hypothetical protein